MGLNFSNCDAQRGGIDKMENEEKILRIKLENLIDDWFAKILYERSIGLYETGTAELKDKIMNLIKERRIN